MNANVYYFMGGVILLAVILWIVYTELRLKKIFRGKKAKDLEEIIFSLRDDIEKLSFSQKETEKYLETAEKRIRKSIQNVNTIRFNPFSDAGSNQSFSIAFLDEEGNGVVVSSLYSREKVNVYAKPIQKYQSEYSLTNEEKEVIMASRNL